MNRRHGWARRLLRSPWALFWLSILSFLENTVLFIALEPLFIPVMVARRRQALLVASVLLLGCLAGALATYYAADALFEPFVKPLLEKANFMEEFREVETRVDEGGFITLLIISISPIPFQLGTVAAGILQYPLASFIAAVVIGRGVRYFGLALLVMWIGSQAEEFMEKYELRIGLIFVILFFALLLMPFFLQNGISLR